MRRYRRKSTKKRRRRRRTRRKSTKKRRRRRRTRRKKGGDRTVYVGDIAVTNVYNKNKEPVGVRLANAIRDTYSENYQNKCKYYCTRLYPSSKIGWMKRGVTGKSSCENACKKTVDDFSQYVYPLPPKGY